MTEKEDLEQRLVEITAEKLVKRVARLEKWLKDHKASEVEDLVFDGNGVITKINKGYLDDVFINLYPLYPDHNLGNGNGNMVTIEF